MSREFGLPPLTDQDFVKRPDGMKQLIRRIPRHTFVTMVHPKTGAVCRLTMHTDADLEHQEAFGFRRVKPHILKPDDPRYKHAMKVQFWHEKIEKRDDGVTDYWEMVAIDPELEEHIKKLQEENRQRMRNRELQTSQGQAEMRMAQAASQAAVHASVAATSMAESEKRIKAAEEAAREASARAQEAEKRLAEIQANAREAAEAQRIAAAATEKATEAGNGKRTKGG